MSFKKLTINFKFNFLGFLQCGFSDQAKFWVWIVLQIFTQFDEQWLYIYQSHRDWLPYI